MSYGSNRVEPYRSSDHFAMPELDCILRRTHSARFARGVVQFNLAVNLAFRLDEYLSPSPVDHAFLYFGPRDR